MRDHHSLIVYIATALPVTTAHHFCVLLSMWIAYVKPPHHLIVCLNIKIRTASLENSNRLLSTVHFDKLGKQRSRKRFNILRLW